MRVEGKCHCGNIQYLLDWPGDAPSIAARTCGCTFCTMHGASWTSHRDAKLSAEIRDDSLVSKYRFGTATADFYVCARCGGVPFVTSAIDGCLYAVVNVNTFESIKPASLPRTAIDFDGEGTGDRLGRRQRNWIASVAIAGKGPTAEKHVPTPGAVKNGSSGP